MSRRSKKQKNSPLNIFRRKRKDPDQSHRDRYARMLVYMHRTFDVKGLTTQGIFTLELAQVFVDLGLGPQSRYGQDPIPRVAQLANESRRSIWEYLTSATFKEQNLVILGAPGSGKTTLLKHLTLALAAPESIATPAHGLQATPIMLYLRDYAAEIVQNPKFSLLDAMQLELQKREESFPLQWLAQDVLDGRCVIMFDGLDEVADVIMRQQVVTWVERQMQRHHKNRFLVTSRPHGYLENSLTGVTVLEVRPFSQEQVNEFVQNWYLANEIMSQQKRDKGVELDAREGADDLIRRLRQTPVLFDMSVNPLLLTMIATVHRYRSSLPGRRVELYEEICEVFLGKRHQARGIDSDLTPAQKKRVLQPLAYYMMLNNKRDISMQEAMSVIDQPLDRVSPQSPRDEFLKMIQNTSGLLVEREPDVLGFAHLTFQEYLTAVHIQDRHLEMELIHRVEDSWWHETIRLYTAQADATNIIRACVVGKNPSIPALTLAMECLEEAREVGAEVRNIADRLEQSVESGNPEIRRVGAEVMLQLRLRRMVRLSENRYTDNSFVSHAEYQLFLDAEMESGRFHQPDHWQEEQYPSGRGRDPIVGIRPLDAEAFCKWLTAKEPGIWQYRLPNEDEQDLDSLLQEELPEDLLVTHWYRSNQSQVVAHTLNLDEERSKEMLQRLDERLINDQMLHRNLRQSNAQFARLRQIILARVKHRGFTLLDFNRNLDVEPSLKDDVFLYFDRIRDRETPSRALVLQHALTQAVERVQNPDLARARSLILDATIERAELLAYTIERAPHIDAPPEIMRSVLHSLNRARELTHKSDQDSELFMSRELTRHLGQALNRTRKLTDRIIKARADARTRMRALSLRRIVELMDEMAAKPAQSSHTKFRRQKLMLMNGYIDLYVDIAILEERITEKLPAVEGLRLIRERG